MSEIVELIQRQKYLTEEMRKVTARIEQVMIGSNLTLLPAETMERLRAARIKRLDTHKKRETSKSQSPIHTK